MKNAAETVAPRRARASVNRRRFLEMLTAAGAAGVLPRTIRGAAKPEGAKPEAGRKPVRQAHDKPNFIIFFTDDQGYNDVGCFGSPRIRTPNFDRMAAEGMKLTNFYAMPVCGPSRAAMMTGCYPIRVGEPGNTKGQHTILHPGEITIAEVLKGAGYATGLVGKWHLAGNHRSKYPVELMPTGQGFEHFFGTPLHNGHTRTVAGGRFRTQLVRQNEVIDQYVEQEEMDMLTQRYTAEAVEFIRRNKDRPFFLYLAHNMPHVPLGASKAFRGRSRQGLYGDVIEELDWSAGQVLATLKELGIDERTLMVFTSDNGPWVEAHLAGKGGTDAHYGSADPLRGSKMTTWDGGPRVPCIVRWPKHVPAGKVSGEIVTTMDFLPTFAKLAGAEKPTDRILDGIDVGDFLLGKTGKSPRDGFHFYSYTHLQGVRKGKWKLVLPRRAKPPWCGWSARMVNAVETLSLYDLDADIEETRNVADQHPDVVRQLMALVESAREDLGDYDRVGKGARFFDAGAKRPDMDFWKGRKPGRGGRKKPKVKPGDAPQAKTGAVYDNARPVGNLRFDFEAGGMQDWRVVRGELPGALSRLDEFYLSADPINKQGKGFLNTMGRVKTGQGGDEHTGTIESPVFRLDGAKMSFLVGGGSPPDTYVALCDAAGGAELMRVGGPRAKHMRRVAWDVGKHKGRKLFLRIVDNSRGGWGHVLFDDFSTEGAIDAEATAARWRGIFGAATPRR